MKLLKSKSGTLSSSSHFHLSSQHQQHPTLRSPSQLHGRHEPLEFLSQALLPETDNGLSSSPRPKTLSIPLVLPTASRISSFKPNVQFTQGPGPPPSCLETLQPGPLQTSLQGVKWYFQ